MAVFEVQGADGETYEIDAPDEGAALKAFQSYKPNQQQPNQTEQSAQQSPPPISAQGFIGNAASDLGGMAKSAVEMWGGANKIAAGGIVNGVNMVLPDSMQIGQNPLGQEATQMARQFPGQVSGAIDGAGHLVNGMVTNLPGAKQAQGFLDDNLPSWLARPGAFKVAQGGAAGDAQDEAMFLKAMEPIDTLPKLGRQMYEKPVTSAVNLSALLSGGATLAGRSAMLGGEGGALAKTLSKGAEYTNPANIVAKPVMKFNASRQSDKAILDAAMSQEEVAAKANSMWDGIRSENIQFPSAAFKPFAADVKKSFDNIGSEAAPAASALKKALIGKLGPMPVQGPTKNVWGHIEHPTPKPDTRTVPFNDVNEIRQSASQMSADMKLSDTERKVAGDLKSKIDDFYQTISGLNNKLETAREMSRRNILAKQLGEMERKADWYTSGNESGIKNQITSFGKKSGKGLTAAEENALKNVSKKEGINSLVTTAGGRLGHLMLGGIGAALGGIPGLAAAGTTSLAARALSEKATLKALGAAKKTVLLGRDGQQLLGKSLGQFDPVTQDVIAKTLRGEGDVKKLLSDLSANRKIPLKDKTLIRVLIGQQAAEAAMGLQQQAQ